MIQIPYTCPKHGQMMIDVLSDTRVYGFSDGVFKFHTADYGSWAGDARIVFRVREDNTAEKRAAEKGIKNYDRIRRATFDEAFQWI